MKQATVTIKNKVGLHARPAAIFVQAALKHKCNISVEIDGKKADAKSILQVLSLGVKSGQAVTITADGEGEDKAIEDLVFLCENELKGV